MLAQIRPRKALFNYLVHSYHLWIGDYDNFYMCHNVLVSLNHNGIAYRHVNNRKYWPIYINQLPFYYEHIQ